jgi:hypothetical protein
MLNEELLGEAQTRTISFMRRSLLSTIDTYYYQYEGLVVNCFETNKYYGGFIVPEYLCGRDYRCNPLIKEAMRHDL